MDMYPLKAQYINGENVIIRVEADNNILKNVKILVYKLENIVDTKTMDELTGITDIGLGSFNDELSGYGVELEYELRGASSKMSTSFDVVIDPNLSLRYGFLSDFDVKDENNGAIEWMEKCHINIVQYYDWSYRHDDLVSSDDDYVDMMGKKIHRNTVISKIEKTHEYGMRSIAYGAVYAAGKSFFEEHKEWAFYSAPGKPFVFIDTFYIMNISEESPWRGHLAEQYKKAIMDMGFDGIHMDTYGFPKKAINYKGDVVKLDDKFGSLINFVRQKLNEDGINPCLIFNNVGNWPVYATANADQNAIYVEVWEPYDRYEHIAEIIREANIYSNGDKPVIIAAYVKPLRTEGIGTGFNAARLLMASVVSNGAYHLLIGENKAALTQGYYSDYTKLPEKEADIIRSYYDFMIRYMNLFYDKSMQSVSMTHTCGDNDEYKCLSHKISAYGEPEKIWSVIRENDDRKSIALINLIGNKDDLWNEGKDDPKTLEDIIFTVKIEKDIIKGVYYASPDGTFGTPVKLDHTIEETNKGNVVKFTVPELMYWGLVWIEL